MHSTTREKEDGVKTPKPTQVSGAWWGRVPVKLLCDKRVSANHREVFAFLAAFGSWREGAVSARADVSFASLEKVGCPRGRAQRAIPKLSEAGWIEQREEPNPRGGRPRHYYILWLDPAYRSDDTSQEYRTSDTPHDSTYRHGDTSSGAPEVSETQAASIENGDAAYRSAGTVLEFQTLKSEKSSPAARKREAAKPLAHSESRPVFSESDLQLAVAAGIAPEHAATVHAGWVSYYYVDNPGTRRRSFEQWARAEKQQAYLAPTHSNYRPPHGVQETPAHIRILLEDLPPAPTASNATTGITIDGEWERKS